jgi:hypothetical protein
MKQTKSEKERIEEKPSSKNRKKPVLKTGEILKVVYGNKIIFAS